MWITTTRPFWDLQNPSDEPVPAGKSLNVTADRGMQLIALLLAVEGGGADILAASGEETTAETPAVVQPSAGEPETPAAPTNEPETPAA